MLKSVIGIRRAQRVDEFIRVSVPEVHAQIWILTDQVAAGGRGSEKGKDRLIVCAFADCATGSDCTVQDELPIDLFKCSLQEPAGGRVPHKVKTGATDVESS